jgi:nucleoside-diphosphate-sugar epimerase
MQTILGAGGVIATELAKTLPQFTNRIRLVSRNPQPVNAADEVLKADLLHYDQVIKAVEGSEVVYLTAGLKYHTPTWREQWPRLMQHVITACIQTNCRLVFFDNVYAYGKVNGWMTEETPYNPCSKKGEVRAQIATRLMEEVHKKNLQAMIVRAADFYGPRTPLSFATVMVFEKFRKRKSAQWMLNDQTKHSFTYTPDAGRATAMLGNNFAAYNQVWHLPTFETALTGKEFIEEAARAFGVKANYQVLSRGLLRVVGWFTPEVRESMEMLYQFETDYLFSSKKFEAGFSMKPVSYRDGLAATAASMK